MCQHLKTLAMSNDYRHITRCEHGAIHLSWDLITIHLDSEILTQLIQILEEGSRLVAPGRARKKQCRILYRQKGYFQVWIRNVAFNLLPVDFFIFTDLVRTALTNLLNGLDQPFADAPRPIYDMAQASVNNRFSLN